MGVEATVRDARSLTGEFLGETHRGLERAQAHPPGNQHEKGPICLWVVGEVTERQLELSKHHYSLSDPAPPPPPPTRHHNAAVVGCPTLVNT